MTNNDPIILPLPTDDATIITLLRDTIRACADEIHSSAHYFADRLDCISDYDDYIPAALGIMTRCTNAILDHEHDTYADALKSLMNDTDFIRDLETADTTLPLHSLMIFPDDID